MLRIPRHFRDSANSKIGTYEAFLDLLTLLCFIFIFAATIYIDRYTAAQAGGASKIMSQEAVRGAVPAVLQRGEVEFKVDRSAERDRLTIMDSVAGQTNQFLLGQTDVAMNLESIRPSLDSATNISIAVFDETQPVSSDVIVAIQRWLSYNGYSQYKFYFVRQKQPLQ